jgi:glutathione S-transferase
VNFDEFRKFSLSARVPCLYDEERGVWDSLAICEYIVERYERGCLERLMLELGLYVLPARCTRIFRSLEVFVVGMLGY